MIRVAAPEARDHICHVDEASIERVVVLFPGALGDFLLALPTLRALRARHAGADFIVVVSSPLCGLAVAAGMADVAVSLDGADSARLFAGDRLPRWLDGRPVVYSWLGADDELFRARVATVAASVRFFRVERGPGTVHAAAAYARAVGVAVDPASLAGAARIEPPPSSAATALFADLRDPVLAIHPGAGSRAKRWDVAGFVQVAQWWRARGGAVVAIAGPAEGDEAPVLGAPEVRDWPLPDLAAVLARATLYLGNDSGVSHLAAAVETPGVVLFGPTDAHRWRPLGGALVVLGARARAPDGLRLSALPATRVVAACRRRFTLTRGDLDTSVSAFRPVGRLERTPK
jgi:glycosyl transferase family 9 (putative heptosyltransferase)